MSSNEAPIAEKLAGDDGKARPAWIEFFSALTRGDVGTNWNVTINNLTTVGTPVITGVYYQNSGFTDFVVKIVPFTNTSSTLGVTYITVPFSVVNDTPCNVVNVNSVAFGVVNAASKQINLPTWTTITSPITITGRVKN